MKGTIVFVGLAVGIAATSLGQSLPVPPLPRVDNSIAQISTVRPAPQGERVDVPTALLQQIGKGHVYMLHSDSWILFLQCKECTGALADGQYHVQWSGTEKANANWDTADFSRIPKQAQIDLGSRVVKMDLLCAATERRYDIRGNRKTRFLVGKTSMGIPTVNPVVLFAKVIGVHCSWKVDECQEVIDGLRASHLGLIVRNCPTITDPSTMETSVRCLPQNDADIMLSITEEYGADVTTDYARTFYVSAYAGTTPIYIGASLFNSIAGQMEFHDTESLVSDVTGYLLAQGAASKDPQATN